MALRISNSMSVTALFVESMFNDEVLSSATAFCWSKPGFSPPYLITNWHVVSGRNAETGKCMSKNLSVPNFLRIYTMPAGNSMQEYIYTIPLVIEDKCWWFEHPRGRAVDVVAVPLMFVPDTDPKYSSYPININPNVCYAPIMTAVASEIFILGYPNGIRHKPWFPIWKRGTIATEPHIDFNGLPLFLADATTRSSMSGSPVLQVSYNYYESESGGVVRNGLTNVKLIGIYSGRIDSIRYSDSKIFEGSELGRVFRIGVIDEILSGDMTDRFGKSVFDST